MVVRGEEILNEQAQRVFPIELNLMNDMSSLASACELVGCKELFMTIYKS